MNHLNTNHLLPGLQTIAEEMMKVRQQIHQHPELGFEEFETAKLVAESLKSWGYHVETGIGKTGVVGQLKKGDGPKIGIRADMDALKIKEENQLPYKSQREGIMHACGHDRHTATLLAAAKYIAENPHFKGTLNLFFQPAEEELGGAKAMIEAGALEKFPCDAIFGFHNMPGFPLGHFGFKDGAALASSDRVTVKIQGKGGHAAMPHFTIDPIVVASSIVLNLQSIVARNVSPLEMTVISVGSIHGGTTFNVIPDSVTLQLSVRNLNADVQDLVEERIKQLIQSQAASYGATAEINYVRAYPILHNSVKETQFAKEVAIDCYGEAKIIPNFPAMTGSEDFAFFSQQLPSSYLFVGNGTDGAHGCSVHNPHYDFNDQLIPIVANYWLNLLYRFCPID